MKTKKYLLFIAMIFSACLFAACGGDDDDDTSDAKQENNNTGSSSNEVASIAQFEKMIAGTWVNAAEYSEWEVYMMQYDKEHASKMADGGLRLNTNHTGAYLYGGRLNNSFTSWKYSDALTWRIISLEETGTNWCNGMILIDGREYEFGFNAQGCESHGKKYAIFNIWELANQGGLLLRP